MKFAARLFVALIGLTIMYVCGSTLMAYHPDIAGVDQVTGAAIFMLVCTLFAGVLVGIALIVVPWFVE